MKTLVEARCAPERAGESASCVKIPDASRNDETIYYLSREALIAIVGRDAATAIVDRFGGARLYLPKLESESYGAFAAAIGREAAAIMCQKFGGERITLPRRLHSLRERVDELLHGGALPAPEIARRLRCSERQIYNILKARG